MEGDGNIGPSDRPWFLHLCQLDRGSGCGGLVVGVAKPKKLQVPAVLIFFPFSNKPHGLAIVSDPSVARWSGPHPGVFRPPIPEPPRLFYCAILERHEQRTGGTRLGRVVELSGGVPSPDGYPYFYSNRRFPVGPAGPMDRSLMPPTRFTYQFGRQYVSHFTNYPFFIGFRNAGRDELVFPENPSSILEAGGDSTLHLITHGCLSFCRALHRFPLYSFLSAMALRPIS